ncbi:hypothetical protein EJ07DRAFT_140506, partial [Lizonia empirigonia]
DRTMLTPYFEGRLMLTTALTEILFDEATKQANELDEHFEKHGKLVGPLHGICMTLKDQFDVEGFDSTLGY